MPMTQHYDRLLFGSTIILTAVGLAAMGSASWVLTAERYHRAPSYFLMWQGATALVGLGLMLAAMHLKVHLILQPKVVSSFLFFSWLLLGAAYLQDPINATHRWLRVAGFSIQPSGIARLATLLFIAVFLARESGEEFRLKPLLPIGGAVMASVLLILLEPDLGSAFVLAAACAAVFFAAGVPTRYFVPVAAVGIGGLIFSILSSPYRLNRIKAFLGAGADHAGYQSLQALIAIGSGGLLGRGYGAGLQKLFFLPEPFTDFVFASTAEELGLIGMLILITLAAVIAWRGLRVALAQRLPAAALASFGITMVFALQSLIHMGVCLRMLPPKGIPFPLVSYGKTDLLITLISIGLLLNFSRRVRT